MRRIFLFVFFFVCSPVFAGGQPFDWTQFDKLLNAHVKPGELEGVRGNFVDYQALLENPSFPEIGKRLEAYDPGSLEGEEKLAFYINAYNYFAIKIVLDNWPLESIKDAGSLFTTVWKVEAGKINNEPVTLSFIEHKVLRGLGEPRIHFAIVCASLSCPDLRNEVYTASQLDAQLKHQMKEFLSNRTKGLRVEGDKWYVSKIFDWFEDDFSSVSLPDGTQAKGVAEYISAMSGEPAPMRVGYIHYDWSLNWQPDPQK